EVAVEVRPGVVRPEPPDAPVVPDDEVTGGVERQGVVVGVWTVPGAVLVDLGPGGPAVGGHLDAAARKRRLVFQDAGDEDPVRVRRVDCHDVVVHPLRAEIVIYQSTNFG